MDERTLDALKKLRDESNTYRLTKEYSPFWSGYWEALDLAIRVFESKHSIIDCCNSRCSSPVKPWHCYECDELDIEYDAAHILEHLNEED